MKIKKIVDLCKKRDVITIYETEELQWISDGHAIYPMIELPRFDEKSFCRTYDVTEKKASKMAIGFIDGLPKNIDFSDAAENEQLVEPSPITIVYDGMVLLPFPTAEGVLFMQQKYMLPLTDIDDSVLNIYIRQTADSSYFIVKNGLMLVAVIAQVNVVNEKFCKELESLYNQCDIALANNK